MLIEIPQILSGKQIDYVRSRLERLEFVDGKLSAGSLAAGVKENLEAAPSREAMELARIVYAALTRSSAFNQFALPRRILPPIFSRYDVGMAYGSHCDIGVMGIDQPDQATRTDLSLTLFLSDPESYEGGELVISTHVGENRFRPAAGTVVVYPSHNLHYVARVTHGVRYAAVSWLQSFVREDDRRELLYELNAVSEELAETRRGPSNRGHTDVMFNIYHKLLRMWVET